MISILLPSSALPHRLSSLHVRAPQSSLMILAAEDEDLEQTAGLGTTTVAMFVVLLALVAVMVTIIGRM